MQESGHYYTVYYVSLAVGFDNEAAYKIAFFAQLPDEVDEFDATKVQKGITFGTGQPDLKYRNAIHIGLHSLNGGWSDPERKFRAKLADELADTRHFGLNIHPFGDSYAHSVIGNTKKLYEAGFGHLRHWTAPDIIQKRKKLYLEYVRKLYCSLKKRSKNSQFARSIGWVEQFAKKVVKSEIRYIDIYNTRPYMQSPQKRMVPPSNRTVIERIRKLTCGELGIEMKTYAPEDHGPIPWSKFKDKYAKELEGITKVEIQRLAKNWAKKSKAAQKEYELKNFGAYNIMRRLKKDLEAKQEAVMGRRVHSFVPRKRF